MSHHSTELGSVMAPPRKRNETAPLGLFIAVSVVTCVVYSIFSTGSMGGCLGGVTGDGGYIDGSGNPTTMPPTCINLTLQPQSYVYAIIAVLAILALVVIRRRQSQSLPVMTITTAALVAIIAIGAIFSAYHFLFVQDALLGDWRNSHDLVVPFLSNLTVERSIGW